MKYYIKNDYYFDIDSFNQFRLTGPENHLFCGLKFPDNVIAYIKSYKSDLDNNVVISLKVSSKTLKLTTPLVTDIRTLRNNIEPIEPKPTYDELLDVKDLLPSSIKRSRTKKYAIFTYLNSFEDSTGQTKSYGCDLLFPIEYEIKRKKNFILITSNADIHFRIRSNSNLSLQSKIFQQIFQDSDISNQYLFSPYLVTLYKEAGENITHLIRTKKTSSFEYGTIFPRDWIESADLGFGDFTEEIVDYMYEQSMEFVNEKGEGWHENVVGQYYSRLKDTSQLIDRKMIDIEPHYILGMDKFSPNFLSSKDNKKKLKAIANYVIDNATNLDLVTFKKFSDDSDEYYSVGNWRDSAAGFANKKPPIAPYDVNCVFYPSALKTIKRYSEFFDIKDVDHLEKLIQKWDQNKLKYRLYHDNGLIGYSLGLYGKKRIPFAAPHLDESYELFYGEPSMEETVSFAKKIMSADYFYTPTGPMLVANDDEDFTTKDYHGKVIWPKQAAFAVAGLYKQYQRGKSNWPENILDLIYRSINETCQACFKGWLDLAAIPELYYYDEDLNKARFYTEQEDYEGQMSLIQLWSSVGARTIMRVYSSLNS